jgi:hypothetical protein
MELRILTYHGILLNITYTKFHTRMPVVNGSTVAKIYVGSTKPVAIGKAGKGNTIFGTPCSSISS